jgi:hypothetical protein
MVGRLRRKGREVWNEHGRRLCLDAYAYTGVKGRREERDRCLVPTFSRLLLLFRIVWT